jgi:hypothetical protein
MYQWFDDFSQETIGNFPSFFASRWAPFGATDEVISQTFPAGDTSDSMGAKQFRLTAKELNNTYPRSGAEITSIAGSQEDEIYAPVVLSINSSLVILNLILRGGGASGSENAYLLYIRPVAGNYQIRKIVNGNEITLASGTIINEPGVVLHNRFSCKPDGSGGVTLAAKYWVSGQSEPVQNTLEINDSAPLAVGWVGVGDRLNNSDYQYFGGIGIGTNGDPAPTGPVAPGGTEINLTLAPLQQHTQAEAVAAAQVSAVDAVILSQSANSEIASVSQIATASGVESQQISQAQQAGLALSALLGSVEAQQLTSAEALDVSIVQPDSLTVAVVEQLLQAEPVSASQSAFLETVIGQSRTEALAVQVAADYTLMAVTAEQLAQVEALEILDGTGLQVVMVEQSTSSETANVTLLALVNGAAAEQGTNANLVVTAATLVITASQAEQLTEAEIADIVGSAMFLDPRELTVSRTTTGFTVRRTTPTYTMQFKHSVH